ncbi:hypothetical protein EN802_21975 [bacterium M00.F.Ca.ET.159.01.1.1]|nr:hypothetical protein EN802_21975 [bacterium M00.F.Ca.ET.159.01.1.1]TGT82612.1 hypothetical protein EN800_20135 [bacterium M00.F.Ca.ET.157.01.1.1]
MCLFPQRGWAKAMGEWFVVVVRNGKDHVTSFERESYARAYADGQRLGLKEPGSTDKPPKLTSKRPRAGQVGTTPG